MRSTHTETRPRHYAIGALPAILALALVTGCWGSPCRRCPPLCRIACGTGVRLRIVPGQSTVHVGERLPITISIENVGEEAVRFPLQGIGGIDATLRFERLDGAKFRGPHWSSYDAQIVEVLLPGDEVRADWGLDLFVETARTPGMRRAHSLLPPGTYRVIGEIAQASDSIVRGPRAAATHVAGLWTGTLVAESGPIVVLPARQLVVDWDLPDIAEAGRPFVARVTVSGLSRVSEFELPDRLLSGATTKISAIPAIASAKAANPGAR